VSRSSADAARLDEPAARGVELVWIDAREAVLAHWANGRPILEHLASDTPAHHRETGHVRHDPRVRHGGGASQLAVEGHRLEHERRFLESVADRIEPGVDVLVIGPGTVREHLARRMRRAAREGPSPRAVLSEAAGPLTDPQIVARLRRAIGKDLPRQTVGRHDVRLGDAPPSRRPAPSGRHPNHEPATPTVAPTRHAR
jgi:hypothetical protein